MYISIIIPTLNEEHFIGGLMQDLQQQTYKDFEVVHVDGGSKDDTNSIVSKFKESMHVVHALSPERGVALQKNMGASLAHGKYLIFADADTRIPDTHFLEHIIQETKKNRCLMYYPIMETDTSDVGIKIAFKVYNKAIEVARMLPTPLNTLGIALFEKGLFTHIDGYKSSPRHQQKKLFAEDHDIFIRARRAGVIGAVARHAHYIYSLRRFEKEGYITVVPKYILSMVERTLGKEFIELNYEMGGHMYQPKDNPSAPHKKH